MKGLQYLISGMSREKIAAALWEYRRFVIEHPGDPVAADLIETARLVHLALHERRRIERAIA